MSSDLTSSSADKRRRVPVLDPEDYRGWEMMFQAYVGFNEWELFETAEPELDATIYAALLTSSQDPTPESKKYEKQVESDKKKWKLNSNKVRQALIESLCENKQTKLMAMEFQQLPTKEFFDAIKINRFLKFFKL
jgi:vancomycin resistance protein YoaR